MRRAGDKTIEKCEIICPFCIRDTKRWKMIPAIWKWNKNHTRLEPEEIDKKAAKEFEQKVLQEHLPNCEFRDIISDSVLTHYRLQRCPMK